MSKLCGVPEGGKCYRDISNRGRRRECTGRGVSIVSTGDREPLTEMVTFQQRLERERKERGVRISRGRAFWSEGTAGSRG